ncbi:transcriptional regulator [archaeon SCG-AAA382B04]|nr:transcriptional regulator [archaeon SCG-AAA382B04]
MKVRSDLPLDPEVIKSIHRSRVREKTLLFLDDIFPKSSYLSQIGREIKSDPSNVKGCLEGMGERYKAERSLIELGLVEEVDERYRVSERGRDIAEKIKRSSFPKMRS